MLNKSSTFYDFMIDLRKIHKWIPLQSKWYLCVCESAFGSDRNNLPSYPPIWHRMGKTRTAAVKNTKLIQAS